MCIIVKFCNWIIVDGFVGLSGEGGFEVESGCYYLYVFYVCLWVYCMLIFCVFKGLNDYIIVFVVYFDMLSEGWIFEDDFDGMMGDMLFGKLFLCDIYIIVDLKIFGCVMVLILWDKKCNMIVFNELFEIIWMLNSVFDGIIGNDLDFWFVDLWDDIEMLNIWIYDIVNNGVYKFGFVIL